MKKIIFAVLGLFVFSSAVAQTQEVEYLSVESFKEKVWDFGKNSQWKYEGKVPAVIDFYADWCGPCKMIAPHLKDLQSEFGSKIKVYKVDVDKYGEIAKKFGIRSIPTLIFAPLEGDYSEIIGARSKESLRTEIQKRLKVN